MTYDLYKDANIKLFYTNPSKSPSTTAARSVCHLQFFKGKKEIDYNFIYYENINNKRLMYLFSSS